MTDRRGTLSSKLQTKKKVTLLRQQARRLEKNGKSGGRDDRKAEGVHVPLIFPLKKNRTANYTFG